MFNTELGNTVLRDAVFAGAKMYAVKLSNGETKVKISSFARNCITFGKFKKSFKLKKSIPVKAPNVMQDTTSVHLGKKVIKTINFGSYSKRLFIDDLITIPLVRCT
jgi:hypothetical protein